MSKHQHTPASAAVGIEHAIRLLEGRWKLVILFHLFGGTKLRFSAAEGRVPPDQLGAVPVPGARHAPLVGGETALIAN